MQLVNAGYGNAVSVACLDLGYRVSYNERTKRVTNEQDDKGQGLILADLTNNTSETQDSSETQDTREADEGSKYQLV